jgi:hypothetical protein
MIKDSKIYIAGHKGIEMVLDILPEELQNYE